MDIFVLGVTSLILAVGYIIRENQIERELKAAYEKGYNDGLYTNVVRVSEEDQA